MKTIYKRLIIYVIGLFTLALGCSFSIMANLGVSPVSSLAYSIHLISPWSVGLASVVVYMAFIAIQMILNRCVDLREACLQMILSVIFGFFACCQALVVTGRLSHHQFVGDFLWLGRLFHRQTATLAL